MIAYICHQFKSDPQGNIAKVAKICKDLTVSHPDVTPIAPHLQLPHYIDEETQRPLALKQGLDMLAACDEVWVYGEHLSTGMVGEIQRAKELKITVRRM
jgi:hypothetical protein